MGQRVIPCDVLNEYITGAGVVVGAAGSHDEVLLELDFRAADSVWAGTTRVVTFRDALSQNPVDVILGVDLLSAGHTDVYLVPIPARAKAIEGEMRMTIRGVIVQGDKELVRVVTKTALFRVLPSELNLYDENTDVPASAAEQLQSQIDGVKGKFVALDEAVDATRQSAEAADASAKSAANSEQRAGELTRGFDERVTTALEDVETARTGAVSDVEAARSGALNNVWTAESAALANIQAFKTYAQGSVEEARQTALTDLNGKVQEVSSHVSEAERQAMDAAKSATDSAGHAADAKRYAEQAADVVGGDFATNADLDAVENKVDQNSSDIIALGNNLTTLRGNVESVANSVTDLENQVEQDVGQAVQQVNQTISGLEQSVNTRVQPITLGGTGASEANQARQNLGAAAVKEMTKAEYDALAAIDPTIFYALTDVEADGVKIEVGSYVGTGTYGSSNPNKLTFGFVPKMVLIGLDYDLTGNWTYPFSYEGLYIAGLSKMRVFTRAKASGSATMGDKVPLKTASGNVLEWYNTSSAPYQLNDTNLKYVYVAIG